MRIGAQLKDKIRQTLVNYHKNLSSPKLSDELDFVHRTASFFKNRSVNHGQQSFSTNARSIDKSPIVEFFHTTPWKNPAAKEIADLLFVSKFKKGNSVIEKRAVIVQSKFARTDQRFWKNIDTAQFYLVLNWPAFTRIKPGPPKLYQLQPRSLAWGTYLFVGPEALDHPVYFTSSRIFKGSPSMFSQKTFTFSPKELNGFDTSPSFLMRQILCLIGEDLLANPNLESFVDEMYRIVGLKPDPPGEFSWVSIDR